MKSYQQATITVVVISLAFITGCKQKVEAPEQLDLLRGELILCSGKSLGDVSFTFFCKASTKEKFGLAMSLLHSFEYTEAEKAFAAVIDSDPMCTMAYWGVAMSIYHSLWEPAKTDQLERGAKILKAAEAIPKTEREQDYLDAIGVYFKDWDTNDAKSRTSMVLDKMEVLYQKYPNDSEAAIFYALALDAAA